VNNNKIRKQPRRITFTKRTVESGREAEREKKTCHPVAEDT
jgi:hypothetical protein